MRKWLVLASYLHKYSKNYADIAQPLTDLLKKDTDWHRGKTHAFRAVKESLLDAPILILPHQEYPFNVVYDASDFAFGSALLQTDTVGCERVIALESC